MKDRERNEGLINAYTSLSQNEGPLLRGFRKKPLHQPMEMMKPTRRRRASSWVLWEEVRRGGRGQHEGL